MNRRDRRAAGIRGRIVEGEPVARVVSHARLLGCTCDPPDVRFTGPQRYGEISHVAIAHEDVCPIVSRGYRVSAMVISNPEGRS